MHHGEGAEEGAVYWQPADGSAPAEPLVTDYPASPSSWSPDGQTLAFVGNPDGQSDIGLLTLGDSSPRWVVASEFGEFEPQISPDGRWLAYNSNRSGDFEIYVQPLEGGSGRVQVSTNGGRAPRWAPDSDVLYYVSGQTFPAPIVAAEFTTEGGFRVTSRTERFDVEDSEYDVSPDGREFVRIDGGVDGTELIWILDWPEIVREMTSGR